MKHSFKKLTAWLCCMAMIISFIPATALPVFAEEATVTYTEEADGVLTADDFAATGAVKLTAATTASATIVVPANAVWYLDLNGQSLTLDTVATLFQVVNKATLTVTDLTGATGADWTEATGGAGVITRDAAAPCKNDGLIYVTGGTFNLEGGAISNVNNGANMSGISRTYSGTFNINGGKISGNKTTSNGGAIFIGQNGASDKATVNMTNGLITGNSATHGGAIYVAKGGTNTFNMTGGEIRGNTASTNGGAVAVAADGTTSFVMNGDAVITANTAKLGGGVYAEGTGVVDVLGGSITGNTATASGNAGGGVFAKGTAIVNVKGGTISKNLADRGNNIGMAERMTGKLTISGGTVTADSDGTYEGVYTFETPVDISGGTIGKIYARGGNFTISGGTIAYCEAGKGDAQTLLTITGNPVITNLVASNSAEGSTIGKLTEGADVTYSSIGLLKIADGTVKQVGKNFTYQNPLIGLASDLPSGTYTLSGDLALAKALTIKAGSDVVIDLNGYTLTGDLSVSSGYFSIAAGGKLTIKDSSKEQTGKVQFTGTASGSGGISNWGTFVLEGGELNGWNRAGAGGFIDVYPDSITKMTGGKITGLSATGQAAIRTQKSGGVFGGAVVEITGGEITGNTSNGDIISVYGAEGDPAYLTIAGDAKVTDNTLTGGAYTITGARAYMVNGQHTHITLGGTAVVGTIGNGYTEGGVADDASFTITGAPVVDGLRWAAKTPVAVSISNLLPGASIKMTSTGTTTADSSATYTVEDGIVTYTYNVPKYPVTINQVTGGTIEVDVEQGAEGATVTVTATPDEGFELVDILVDGVAIEGNTFTIVADAAKNVVTATFKATAVALPVKGGVVTGEYKLTENHVLEGALTFAKDVDAVIDLNGNTISMADGVATAFFSINAGGKLTIKDSVGGGTIQFKEMVNSGAISVTGTFVLEGGTLTGWSRVENGVLKAGGFIDLIGGSTFRMTGGKITNIEADSNTVIRSHGPGVTVEILGGEISGNSSNGNIIGVGYYKAATDTAAAKVGQSWLHIGGEAVIKDNLTGGKAPAFNVNQISAVDTIVTIDGKAYIEGNLQASLSGLEPLVGSQINISGTPYVKYVRGDSSAKTTSTISELEEGAEIHTAYGYGFDTKGDVIETEWTNVEVSGKADDHGYVYTYGIPEPEPEVYSVTVGEVVNGTVTVDPDEGVEGTTVTVTATPAEGYELTAILVDGKAIEGTTFEITGNHTVTATFVAKEVGPKTLPTSGNVEAGEYVLEENLTLEAALNVPKNVTVVIDLNGYNIITAADTCAFTVGGNLTIKDSTATGTPGVDYASGAVVGNTNATNVPYGMIYVGGGTFTLESGKLTGYNHTGGGNRGGAVGLLSGATFTMNGGEISNNKTLNGGGVFVTNNSAFVMNGGAIVNNTATGNGGGVNVEQTATFTMNGGLIDNNTAANGGGIYTKSYAETSVTLAGGTISNNKATGIITDAGGAGLYVGYHIQYTKDADGKIISTEYFYTNATISGNAVISGNKATRAGGGVYVAGESSLTVENGSIINNIAEGFTSIDSKTNEPYDNSFGGGIFVLQNGTVTVNNGTFTGNTASNKGGAIGLDDSSAGTVTINGGTFTGNTAVRGNSIHMGEGQASTLNLNGGTTDYDNSSYGGVYSHTGTINVTGGTHQKIYMRKGTINISGNPVVTNGSSCGVRVSDGAVANVSGLTTGASLFTWDTATLTVNDDTVYTADDRNYKFIGDVTLSFADQFKDGQTLQLTADTNIGDSAVLTKAGTYTLDLNGFTLTGNAAPYFVINEGVKLTVIDSSAEGTGKMVGLTAATDAMIKVNGGSFSLTSGKLTGHTNANLGGAIYVAKGYVSVSGGEISGNTAHRGGAISGPDTGSAIDVTIEINDGIVTGNVTNRGATIYTQTGATVAINGGKVGYGTVNGEPATINASGAEDLWIRNSVLTITGGDINGIYFNGNAANEYTMTISGDPTIKFLQGAAVETAFIGDLTTGARIVTSGKPLTATDDTVHAKNGLYRFAGDVGPLTRILFVANSFGGDTTSYLDALSAYYNVELEHAYLYIGSQSIRWHAQSLAESLREQDLNGDGRIGDSRSSKDELYGYAGRKDVSIPEAMTDGEWDYVVLQPGVQYVGFEGTYNSDIDFLMDYIAKVQPNAKILWSQTWAVDNLYYDTTDVDEGTAAEGAGWSLKSSYLPYFGNSQQAMYDAILYNTDKFIAGDDAYFDFDAWLPIGIAIQEMRNGYTDTSSLESYLATRLTRDGFHLSGNAGRMIAGLVTMKTLFPDVVDLSALTTEDITGMFKDAFGSDYRADTFEPTEANVTKLLNSVQTAYNHAVAGTVPAYGDGTANKQFNPDASGAYTAVYEGITEVGQAVTTEGYATTGAGKIVIYEGNDIVATLDEAWLDANTEDFDLGNRYQNILDGEDYYIQADMQAPQLVVNGDTLYLTFDVKLYSDTQNTIYNGGIYLATSADAGANWTLVGKIAEGATGYGLTQLADKSLLLSVAGNATKVVTLSAAGAVTGTVELDANVADVAFAEVGDNVYALTSNGAMYVSADKGASWTATGIANGTTDSPDMVVVGSKGVIYVTWSVETERNIYGKVWTIDAEDANLGWNNSEAVVIADYAANTAYNGKTTGGQPSAALIGNTKLSSTVTGAIVKVTFADGNELNSVEKTVLTQIGRTVALQSSLAITFAVPTADLKNLSDEQFSGLVAKFTRYNPAADFDPVVTEIPSSEWYAYNKYYTGIIYSGISAKQMGDILLFAIYDAEGNQVTTMDKYSVRTYVNNKLSENAGVEAGTEAAAFRTMLVDMLNYGAAAQTYLNYATTDMVNAHLTETQKSWASPKLVLDETLTLNGYQNTSNGVLTGKNLSLKSVVEMNINYVASSVPDIAYVVATYTPHNTGAAPVTVRFDEFIETSDKNYSYKGVKINTLASADVLTNVTFVAYDSAGNPIPGATCVYSISVYAYNQVKAMNPSKADSVILGNLCEALMQFGNAAHAYLHFGGK